MPAMSERNKKSANSSRKKRPASLGQKKKREKKMPVSLAGTKIDGKLATAGELPGL